jgi:hypothetical protein
VSSSLALDIFGETHDTLWRILFTRNRLKSDFNCLILGDRKKSAAAYLILDALNDSQRHHKNHFKNKNNRPEDIASKNGILKTDIVQKVCHFPTVWRTRGSRNDFFGTEGLYFVEYFDKQKIRTNTQEWHVRTQSSRSRPFLFMISHEGVDLFKF